MRVNGPIPPSRRSAPRVKRSSFSDRPSVCAPLPGSAIRKLDDPGAGAAFGAGGSGVAALRTAGSANISHSSALLFAGSRGIGFHWVMIVIWGLRSFHHERFSSRIAVVLSSRAPLGDQLLVKHDGRHARTTAFRPSIEVVSNVCRRTSAAALSRHNARSVNGSQSPPRYSANPRRLRSNFTGIHLLG